MQKAFQIPLFVEQQTVDADRNMPIRLSSCIYQYFA